jgi:NAD kinase
LTVELLRYGYDVVERAKLEKILKEFKLSSSGMVDDSKAVKVGKLAGADAIIIGNDETISRSSDNLKHLVLKLLDTETGSVMIAMKLPYKAEISEAIPEMIQAMQLKLSGLRKNRTF